MNDNYPIFGPHKTAISVREDVKVPSVIETIEATDQDEGRFGQVIYKLDESSDGYMTASGDKHSTPINQMFSVDTIDGRGIITLISPLDYEQRALYQLKILAIDRAIENERLSTSTSILITVEDCEDQPPMFTFVPSITRIPENLPIGSPIVRVSATDGDRGINNPIQYKLMTVNNQESGQERQLFAIDSSSGLISVAGMLDREESRHSSANWPLQGRSPDQANNQQQPGSYVLQIKASELNSQIGANSVLTELTILLTDVNDEVPTFNQPMYHGEIMENSAPESLVSLVQGPQVSGKLDGSVPGNQHQASAKVFDRDQGTNGTFTLHLEGEYSQLFEIWPKEATNEASFMIKVASNVQPSLLNLLDFEKMKQFQFTIVAREKYPSSDSSSGQLRFNTATMIVYLRDANDNYPQFENELYKVEIPENAIKGMHVCAVKATDLDSHLYGSEGIRYTEIRGEKANRFKLDPVTGIVSLKTSEHGFDREQVAQHHLIIEARDSNGLGNRNTTQLLIQLIDVNDQAPKFLLDQYEAFIYENELDFQSPLQVQAIDNDAPNTVNSKITYSIVNGDPQQNFTIDPQTGRIKVRNTLVVDHQRNRANSDADSDLFGYTLNNEKVSLTGGGLDFERIAQKRDDTKQFNLTIRATDSGLPESHSATTNVIIVVYDKNDHAPVFSKSIYQKSIKEDAREGSQVLQVSAQDGDHSPTNSKITYRISSGASDKFVIDSDTGLITVANGANLDIDRAAGGQKRNNYLLSVLAFDGSFGPNQKSSSALVNITIIDVNNKAPEFTSLGATKSLSAGVSLVQTTMSPGLNTASSQQQFMVVHVNEDAPYGLIVTRVVATDLDSTAELRYSINYARSEARNEDMVVIDPLLVKDIFSIEPTDGTIKVAKSLDRELFDQVKLRLQVEDIAAQTPDQVAHAYLLIRITDVNDNRPTFKKSQYKAVVNENSIGGTSIVTLTADDRDLNKTLRYSLEGSSEMMRLIRINSRTGEVTVNDKIDRELYSMINVTVKAEDYGHPHSLIGTTHLSITVRDENDNNPAFLSAGSSQTTPPMPPRNENVPKNHNNETGSYSPSSYKLRSLNASQRSAFELSTTNLPVDIDKLDSILIEDHPLSSVMSQLPLLSPGSSARIREDAPIGYQFAYVKAEDADVGNNGRVTYLLDSPSSGGKFKIDRDTGIISVSGVLDRELSKQYSLIIEACDNYDLGYSTGESRRAFTQINIIITDVNDNAPVLTTNLQSPFQGAAHHQAEMAPTYEEIMNSPGPYQFPLSDCLFISEFQQINEPILTITATDADDSATANGQINISIVNNLPHNEFFGLMSISSAAMRSTEAMLMATTAATTTTTSSSPVPTDYLGFGDLNLGETSSSAASVIVEPSSSKQQSMNDDEVEENRKSTKQQPNRMRRQAEPERLVMEPEPSRENYYSKPPLTNSHQVRTSSNLNQKKSINVNKLATQASTLMRTLNAPTASPVNLMMPATMATVHRHSIQPLGRSASSATNNPNLDSGEQQVHLIVAQSLKERVGNYSILVRASDRGQPSLSTVKVINICVQDFNNHAPVFVRPPLNHTLRVMENATLGTFVTQMEATDKDYGLNGEIQYSLKPINIQNSNNDWQSFKIDRLTGIITTAKQFKRQVKKYYTLRVQAQDFGKPTVLSSDIDVNIMIVNSGQYQPEFDSQVQQLQFTENVEPGIEVFTLLPTTNLDDDPALINAPASVAAGDSSSSPHQATNWLATPCYYIIDSDDHDQVFHLDRYTHRLTNQKVIDREKKSNYTLLVQATNSCSKVPAAPIYLAASNGGARENLPNNAAVTTTTSQPASAVAIDYRSSNVDINSETSSKEEEEPAEAKSRIARSIAKQTKQLLAANETTSARLQASSDQVSFENRFNNQATIDALLASDKTLLKVFIKVKDVNDNAPRFTQRVYTGGITTEADFGTVFMIVQAIDNDADSNSLVTYSIVRPIKRNLMVSSGGGQTTAPMSKDYPRRSKRAALTTAAAQQSKLIASPQTQVTTSKSINNQMMQYSSDQTMVNDIPDGDDLFMINSQTGEISLNFDPQKHMKGYFEFEIMANDTDGFFDTSKVFIYLLRQDQRVKFVLRLTPQELRQRLNKFRSVFGNITGAIVNIDSYKYYENHDGTVDKKKTSLYLHFVNPDDNTIIDVDKVLTLIDNNIEYLDELYKEFHVLSSEAAHLPLSSSALIDPMDQQVKTGLLGVSSFLALILVLVIGLCINQRTRYERQLKAATVSAFGSSPLHLNPDFQSQTNLPNTNLHSQDPNPIWVNGYSEQDWLASGGNHHAAVNASGNDVGGGNKKSLGGLNNGTTNHHHLATVSVGIEDNDYLSSENSDLNSLSGTNQLNQYNVATTATPRDSLNSSHGRVSGSAGSSSASTTNDRQALCRVNGGRQTPTAAINNRNSLAHKEHEVVGVLKNGKPLDQSVLKKRAGLVGNGQETTATSHSSTFGAFKEVTIYTDHQDKHQLSRQGPNNLVRQTNNNQPQKTTSQVNKIASQFNNNQQQILRPPPGPNQIYQIGQHQQQQRIIVHANGADVNQGIIKSTTNQLNKTSGKMLGHQQDAASAKIQQDIDNNLNKLSILNLETTEL